MDPNNNNLFCSSFFSEILSFINHRCSEVHKKYGETKPNRSQDLLICLLPGVSFVTVQLGFVSVELPCGLFSRHKKCYVDLRRQG